MAQPAVGYAARDSSGHLSPFSFQRRATGPDDITFKVVACGICHSDLHMIKNGWGGTTYPLVPGHELMGIVTKVGSNVTKVKEGDHVGVGCMVWSCGADSCVACKRHLEQSCPKVIYTYGGVDVDGTPTYGGYSNIMVVNQKFCVKVPKNLPLDAAAPLLCAGITVYSPMKHFRMTQPGTRFGVVGLGGLGHMGVKFGKVFGLHVTVISTSPHKEKEAKEVLGADDFIVSKDPQQMEKAKGTFDYIIDTVAMPHPLDPLLCLLTLGGKLVLVGLPEEELTIKPASIVGGRKILAGSNIGGMMETQEMIDFCAEKNITATIEKIPIDYVNTAMERLAKADVKYRFVIDVEGSLKA